MITREGYRFPEGKRCPEAEFDALLRDHFYPNSKSNQYLRKISEQVKHPILANSLANVKSSKIRASDDAVQTQQFNNLGAWILDL